jgi:hypothetical protein
VAREFSTAYAKPFRQRHKNDFRDPQAIAEAVQRPPTDEAGAAVETDLIPIQMGLA